jgi:hypothetical protein
MRKKPAILMLSALILFIGCEQDNNTEKKSTISESQASPYSDISNFNPADTLFRIQMDEEDGLDRPCGYINQKGDTIIPLGTYTYCFLDTVITFAIVADPGKTAPEIYAIDQEQNRLFELYWYDNGPDYVSEELFRMKRNGKIGYAKPNGEIAIKAQFACASSFEDGRAKVSLDCERKKVGEYTEMQSDAWFYINKSGVKIE